MIKKILLLILFLAIISAFYFIPHEAGEVAITYGNWHFESNIWMSILGLVAVYIILKIVFNILKFIFDIPGAIAQYKQHRWQRKMEGNLENGILNLVTCNWDAAYKYLKVTNNPSNNHIINLLACAIAANKINKFNDALGYIQIAEEKYPENLEATLITKSQILLDNKKYNSAITELERLLTNNGESKARLFQLSKAYEKNCSWSNLLELTSKFKSYKVFEKNIFINKEITWAENLIALHKDYKTSYPEILDIFNNLPSNLQNNSNILIKFLEQTENQTQDCNIDYAINKSLTENWDHNLLNIYIRAKSSDYNKRIKNLEKLINFHPNDPAIFLALGVFSLHAQLWGKGKDYLLKALMLNAQCVEAKFQLEILQHNLGEINLPKNQLDAYMLAFPYLVNEKTSTQ